MDHPSQPQIDQPKSAQPKRLLIVEDDFYLCDIYRIQAEAEGLEVDTAADGVEAISKVQVKKPDIILLDLMLPHMDGLEVLKVLREREQYKDIPVVVATNREDPETALKAQKLGISEYLLKVHYNPEEIINHVKRYIATDTNESPQPQSV